jgi:cytochrome c-type biogenesis protein
MASFASPCCLPLLPAYVGYLVGPVDDGRTTRRRAALTQALAFVLGFSAVFIALWASVGLIGSALRDQSGLLRQLAGATVVFLGLHVAGVIDISVLSREVRLPVGPFGARTTAFPPTVSTGPSHGRSALLGVVFAAGWTPCIGPILGGIIGLASVSASVAEGTVLLVAYSAGLALPFILVALGATTVSQRLGWLRDHHAAVSAVTGALLVAVGLLMITNLFVRVSGLLSPLGG